MTSGNRVELRYRPSVMAALPRSQDIYIVQEAPDNGSLSVYKEMVLTAIRDEADSAVEMAISYCEDEVLALDEKRWNLGDIAAALRQKPSYGKSAVRQLAQAVGIKTQTAYQYAEMAIFYPVDIRQMLADKPVGYTRLRDARKLGTLEKALAFIDGVIDDNVTPDATALKAAVETGAVIEPCTLFDERGYVLGRLLAAPKINGEALQMLQLAVPLTADMERLLWLMAQRKGHRAPQVQIVIREVL